ncbi:MAG: hypothetical protein M5U34_40865 [Chloroflexi bacterium]|nr:hypothetical protein [Chloroflexota bacterium]
MLSFVVCYFHQPCRLRHSRCRPHSHSRFLAVAKRRLPPPPSPCPPKRLHSTHTPAPHQPRSRRHPGNPLTPPTTSPPTVTPSPTSRPVLNPTLDATVAVGFLREGEPTPSVPIPTAVPVFDMPKGATNILLLGSDDPPLQ